MKLWEKSMSTEAGREMGRKLIEGLVSGQKFDLVGIYNYLKEADLKASSFLRKSSSGIL